MKRAKCLRCNMTFRVMAHAWKSYHGRCGECGRSFTSYEARAPWVARISINERDTDGLLIYEVAT